MLDILANYAVPANLFLLMFIAGTEVTPCHVGRIRRNTRAVLLGSAGQLLLLPPLALLILATLRPPPEIATGIMFLALCPGGGISNYYCYLARCNVLLSATITAVGTVLSLSTIPIWLKALPLLPATQGPLITVPGAAIIGQLLVLMILPMTIAMLLRHALPDFTDKSSAPLKRLSIVIISLILALAIWTTGRDIVVLAQHILIGATVFIGSAMVLGMIMGCGLEPGDRTVLAIESGVRNIGVALILGTSLMPRQAFGTLASFLTGYFVVEIIIMLNYARFVAGRAS
jgi:BASS family bile acid:Na+ symporter